MKYSAFTMVILFILTGAKNAKVSQCHQLQVDQDGNAWRLDIVSGETIFGLQRFLFKQENTLVAAA